jgi:hypothetical protein
LIKIQIKLFKSTLSSSLVSNDFFVSKEILKIWDLRQSANGHDQDWNNPKNNNSALNLAIGLLNRLFEDNKSTQLGANLLHHIRHFLCWQFNWLQVLFLHNRRVVSSLHACLNDKLECCRLVNCVFNANLVVSWVICSEVVPPFRFKLFCNHLFAFRVTNCVDQLIRFSLHFDHSCKNKFGLHFKSFIFSLMHLRINHLVD